MSPRPAGRAAPFFSDLTNMASKRRLRRKACEGKQKHATRERAVAHLISLEKSKDATGLGIYLCKHCHHWHVGHTPGSRALSTLALE